VFREDEARWLNYIRTSIVDTVIEKDIAQLRRISRPALFKQVFELICSYPAMEIRLRKIVGQLQDPGIIETVKHYIEILEGAFLVKTLQKFSTNTLKKNPPAPKFYRFVLRFAPSRAVRCLIAKMSEAGCLNFLWAWIYFDYRVKLFTGALTN
jgi:predicted AAA+ superfamily ATPase